MSIVEHNSLSTRYLNAQGKSYSEREGAVPYTGEGWGRGGGGGAGVPALIQINLENVLGCVYHHTSGVESGFPNDFQGDFCR